MQKNCQKNGSDAKDAVNKRISTMNILKNFVYDFFSHDLFIVGEKIKLWACYYGVWRKIS